MTRRNSFQNLSSPNKDKDERQSIGDFYVSSAIDSLKERAGAAVATMTHYTTSREGTLAMLFDDAVLAKLQAVRGMVETRTNVKLYKLADDCHLGVDFEGAKVPAIEDAYLVANSSRVGPLIAHMMAVKEIHDKYEEVKAVLRWFNRHATPGAIRYYWPSAMKLCEKSPVWKDLQGVPTRYSIPPRIGDWSQSVKEAAATVTAALLLPSTATPRPRNMMWLKFPSRTVRLTIDTRYETDDMTYFL